MNNTSEAIDKRSLSRSMLMVVVGSVVLVALVWAGFREVLSNQLLADPESAKQVNRGEEIYQAQCAECHGAALEGQRDWKQRLPDGTMPAPPHDDTGHTWHHPDQQLFDYTKLGGAAVVPAPFKSAMPGFGEALSDEEIWAVLAFIKSRWSPRSREIQEQRTLQQQ